MDTIQLQCGNCKNVMAISVVHLGQQVQCPHCRSVVQTPPPEPTTEPARQPKPTRDPDATLPPPEASHAPVASEAEFAIRAGAPSLPESAAEAEFAKFKPKPRKDYSFLLIMALIFLVPYAVTMTLFVAWLVYTRSTAPDGLEYLRDPAPGQKGGGARPARSRPSHETEVAAHRKTTLGKKVTAPDIEVTPMRVVVTKEGDLKLILRVKNVGDKSAFEPISLPFLDERKAKDKLYTFLESRSKKFDNIYGGDHGYHKNREAKDAPQGFTVLGPRDEVTLALVTNERYHPTVAAIAKSTDEEFTWRIQLRRGFHKVDGKDVSVTTVIGVDFSSKDIEREGKS